MKRLLVLVVLLISMIGPAPAQDLPKFKKPLPPEAQVLKMRYEGINDWAYKNAPAMNEVQADNLAEWYAGIREKANKKLLDDANLEAATKALNKWSSSRWEVIYMQAGGGTMYSHASIREVAVIADLEADAIKAWKAPGTSASADTVASFKVLKMKKTEYNHTPADEYAKALADEAAALDQLKAALRKLPPGPRAIYAKWIHKHAATRW